MFENSYGLKWRHLRWVAFFAVVVVALASIAAGQVNDPKDDITGTVSKAEPPAKQDGTPSHPYAEASQRSPGTDLIIWPKNNAIPNIPPGISICFVGNHSFNTSDGPNLEVRGR